MSKTKGTLLTIGAVLAFIILAFSLEWFGMGWERYFGPKRQAVKREIFKETRSFDEGKRQDLVKYRLEYQRATDPSDKAAIASAIRMTFADYDTSKLQPELRTFVDIILSGGMP
jgi:hypothetical protein